MGKNKSGGKGADVSATTNGAHKKSNETKPDASVAAAEGLGNEGKPPTNTGSGGASTTGDLLGDTRPRKSSMIGHASSADNVRWLDFQTSDLQVMVAETEVFRVHQEIMAAHSTFFREQLQISVEKDGLVAAPRAGDVPVVVLRDICVDAFVNVISLIYPPPRANTRRTFTRIQAEELLRTAYELGMPGVIQTAMEILATDHHFTPISLFELAGRCGLVKWQLRCVRELVYRTRPLSDEEALAIGTINTARIARLREIWRAKIFARFEPVQSDSLAEPKPHRSGEDSDLVRWSAFEKSEEPRPELGRCQQAILEALKVVFNIDGPKSDFERYIIQEDSSVMRNLAEWLRLGGMAGGMGLCRGCMGSIDRAVRVYCRKDEMDVRIERELGGTPEVVEQPFFDC
ncbi:unnamed protein product [Rhizoctonia solani]|uniref:BTB domain-containing protein n=1 Tax=Rhizoctonia solani TaxID=456999 RepID=A0A8H3CXU7_9AGAM|nr:unnamed protein product [Rhizoctonia solani]